MADYSKADLEPRQLAMLRYADKLTGTPNKMVRDDVGSLREVGFTDEDILAIAEITSYYAFVNRIADGLGVELEAWGDSETA